MAGLHVPLPTLRDQPYDWPRMARGRDGSLLLSRTTLSFDTPRRLTRRYQAPITRIKRASYFSGGRQGSPDPYFRLLKNVEPLSRKPARMNNRPNNSPTKKTDVMP